MRISDRLEIATTHLLSACQAPLRFRNVLCSSGLPVFHRTVLPMNSKPVFSRRQIRNWSFKCEWQVWIIPDMILSTRAQKFLSGCQFSSDRWMFSRSPWQSLSRRYRTPFNITIYSILWLLLVIDNALCCSEICAHSGIPRHFRFFDKHIYLWLYSKGSRQMINLFFVRWTDFARDTIDIENFHILAACTGVSL